MQKIFTSPFIILTVKNEVTKKEIKAGDVIPQGKIKHFEVVYNNNSYDIMAVVDRGGSVPAKDI